MKLRSVSFHHQIEIFCLLMQLTFWLYIIFFITEQLLFFFSDSEIEWIFVVIVACFDIIVSFNFVFVDALQFGIFKVILKQSKLIYW